MAEISPARLIDGSIVQSLRVRVDRSIRGVQITRSVMQSGRLTSIHEREEQYSLHQTLRGRAVLTRDNPFLDAAARESLDNSGLIKVGVVVEDNTVLASILQTIENGQDAAAAVGMVQVEDDSLTAPFGWHGATVIAARYDAESPTGNEPPKNQIGKVSVQLRLVLPISVGDALLMNGRALIVASASESANVDIIVDESIGKFLEIGHGQLIEFPVSVGSQPARWAIAARSTGMYSLMTSRPLKRFPVGGQPVSPAHAHTLAAAGLSVNLAELVTIKSDDIAGRAQLKTALRGAGEYPVPGTPETFRVLLCELMALGFKPLVYPSAAGSDLSLGFMTDADRIGSSAGAATKAETINFRTLAPVPDGIMCERIFGHEDGSGRRTTFGHIQLPDPVVPWIFRVKRSDGGPSILSQALGVADDQIAAILNHQLWVDENSEIVDGEEGPGRLSGPLAINQLLYRLPDDALPSCLRSSRDGRSALVARTILLLPPELRPLVLLHNGNFATSDLNDHYRRVVNRVNRLRKLKELNAPQHILRNELRMLQETVDSLFANTSLAPKKRVCGPNGKPLVDLLNIALTRLGSDDGKPTDYSARVRAVEMAVAEPDVVVLPQQVAKTLDLRPRMPVLVTRPPRIGEFATPILPLRTAIHDHAVIGLQPSSFGALFPAPADMSECIIHRPVTPPAVEEALAHIGRVLLASAVHRASWMDESDQQAVLSSLLDASFRGVRLSLRSPSGILLAGTGSARFSATDLTNPGLCSDAQLMKRTSIEVPASVVCSLGPMDK